MLETECGSCLGTGRGLEQAECGSCLGAERIKA